MICERAQKTRDSCSEGVEAHNLVVHRVPPAPVTTPGLSGTKTVIQPNGLAEAAVANSEMARAKAAFFMPHVRPVAWNRRLESSPWSRHFHWRTSTGCAVRLPARTKPAP